MTEPQAQGAGRAGFASSLWRDPDTWFLLLAVAAGLAGALGAVVFRTFTHDLIRLWGGAEDIVVAAGRLAPWLRVLLPTAGGLVGGVIAHFFFAEKGPSGISHLIEVVSLGRRVVRLRPSLGRVASSLAVISTGGSEGREGPIVQIGAASASALARLARLSPERVRILTACGMAAGIAGAYNTPIAATLFVLEVVVGTFSMAIFGPAVVSAVVSTVTVRMLLGAAPIYQVPPFELSSLGEFVPYAVIGVLSGVSSALFARILAFGKRLARKTGLPIWATMPIGGAIVGAIGILYPQVWGNGFEAANGILQGNPSLGFLLALYVGKMVATSATIGSGGVGGVFTPTLLVGATLGGVVARVTQGAAPVVAAPVAGYALLGMGGLMAGMTRAPLLAVIMMFELSESPAVLLPMLVVSVLSILAARVFQKHSIYIESLRSAGIVWEKTPEATAASSLKVADVMRTDVSPLARAAPLSEVLNRFLKSRSLMLYVADEEGRLLGAVDIHAVKEIFSEKELSPTVIAEDMVSEVPSVTPQESLTSVNEKLWFRDLGQLPVVDSTGRFLGIVTRRDLLGAFDREVLQRDRLVARFRATSGGDVDYFELPEKHRLAEIEVPDELVGRAVSESRLRSRFGASVLAVKRLTAEGLERRFVPGPEDRLRKGDVLIVLATDEAIEKLREGRA
jgi:CIC family chloride channel protein